MLKSSNRRIKHCLETLQSQYFRAREDPKTRKAQLGELALGWKTMLTLLLVTCRQQLKATISRRVQSKIKSTSYREKSWKELRLCSTQKLRWRKMRSGICSRVSEISISKINCMRSKLERLTTDQCPQRQLDRFFRSLTSWRQAVLKVWPSKTANFDW